MKPIFLRLFWDRAWVLLVVTTMMWGANGVASRLAVDRISPMSLVFLRWFVVCAFLAIVLRRAIARNWDMLRAHRRKIILMAAVGFTGFTIPFYYAAYWTTAVNIVLLQVAIPALVLAGSALSGRERVTRMQVAGLAIAVVGVVVIATHGAPLRLLETRFNFGDILILIACIFYAGYTLALRDRPPLPPLVFFTALAFGAFVSAAPFMVAEYALGGMFVPTWAGFAILVFVAIGPSLISQVTFMRGVELIGPARAGLFTNLTPIFGAFFAVVLLGEEFHVFHAVALALALSGIWIAEQRR